ncbi:uncharacterized protein PHACADRAFT_261228 [Phanerochaete carnosa HHB-10118-sp]|uniref:ABM domain-containing protein n=1 Tax=Phanerochaete carnosa (strain HHB-10118-sp) TaxID=650164 RepID=K5W177_PHACS|nr:uncharacterized protein PHACADRAFT_261228 [Phanerochaete carnosa HHB-10118-sp]EKM52654.1 hypothetical protein PHACADRAFT_261228 [Phanerochaete carnosa HHB-10118-sp]
MAPALEVLFAQTTEAYRKDPFALNPVLEIVDASKGSLGIYHGAAVEDPSILVILVPWATLEDHNALINDKERYAKLVEVFAKAGDVSTINLFHVYFDGDLATVLNAPFTSFTHIISAKPGKTNDDLQATVKTLASLPQVTGCHGGSFAKAVEKDEYVMLYGWDDPKIHHAAAELEETQKAVKQAAEVIDQIKYGHVKLVTYKRYQS